MDTITASATLNGHKLDNITVINPGAWAGQTWLIEIGGSYSPIFFVVEADSASDAIDEFVESEHGHHVAVDPDDLERYPNDYPEDEREYGPSGQVIDLSWLMVHGDGRDRFPVRYHSEAIGEFSQDDFEDYEEQLAIGTQFIRQLVEYSEGDSVVAGILANVVYPSNRVLIACDRLDELFPADGEKIQSIRQAVDWFRSWPIGTSRDGIDDADLDETLAILAVLTAPTADVSGYTYKCRDGITLDCLPVLAEVVDVYHNLESSLSLYFRLPKNRAVVGHALGEDGMLFRGELVRHDGGDCSLHLEWQARAVSQKWFELDDSEQSQSEADDEDEETDLSTTATAQLTA